MYSAEAPTVSSSAAMFLLGVNSEIAADEETVEASAQYIYGDEDDEEESDESDDDEIERNATF